MTESNYDGENRGLGLDLQSDAEALRQLAEGPGREAAESLQRAFERTGKSISSTLARAAKDGELSFRDMAASVVRSLSQVAIERYVSGPLTKVFEQGLGNLPIFSGARAGGGPVTAGGAYLVGERGPELFVPHGTGEVQAQTPSAGPIVVNLHLPPGTDAQGLVRSEQQIAASLARATRLGQRSL